MTDMSGFKKAREKGGAMADEATAQMAAATQGATELIKSTLQATQEYNAKVLQFALANSNAALEYLSKLSGAKTPSDFIELTTRHMREQSEVLNEQAKELAGMAQKFLPKPGDLKMR